MSEKKPTLAYGPVRHRKSPIMALVIFAMLLGIILAGLWVAWHFGFKPDLDKGIWP
jgi:hypothetical protein